MKVLSQDNFPTIFAINIPWALLFSWRQLFSMHSLISLNCIAEVRSSWNVIFSWSIPVVSVGCTAGFIPDLPRLPHTERHFHSCQQNPHQPLPFPHSLLTTKSHLSPGLWWHLPPKTHITVPSALTLKVMMRWVKWNSASRLSWIVAFSRPEKERDKDMS